MDHSLRFMVRVFGFGFAFHSVGLFWGSGGVEGNLDFGRNCPWMEQYWFLRGEPG